MILQTQQNSNLSGNKICNYWLYVIYQYTDRKYKNIECLTVAPDTQVVQATYKLGLISNEELNKSDVLLYGYGVEMVLRRSN